MAKHLHVVVLILFALISSFFFCILVCQLVCLIFYVVNIFFVSFQDILFLACSHPENRTTMTSIAEWPEWILEVLIYNHEVNTANFLTT
jgi:hypothetical protein